MLDLCAGYDGIGLDEASQPCKAFSTKNRHFQFTRLNMGYVNSRSFFTRSLYKIFAAEVRLTDVTDCISTNKNVTTLDVEHRHV